MESGLYKMSTTILRTDRQGRNGVPYAMHFQLSASCWTNMSGHEDSTHTGTSKKCKDIEIYDKFYFFHIEWFSCRSTISCIWAKPPQKKVCLNSLYSGLCIMIKCLIEHFKNLNSFLVWFLSYWWIQSSPAYEPGSQKRNWGQMFFTHTLYSHLVFTRAFQVSVKYMNKLSMSLEVQNISNFR